MASINNYSKFDDEVAAQMVCAAETGRKVSNAGRSVVYANRLPSLHLLSSSTLCHS